MPDGDGRLFCQAISYCPTAGIWVFGNLPRADEAGVCIHFDVVRVWQAIALAILSMSDSDDPH